MKVFFVDYEIYDDNGAVIRWGNSIIYISKGEFCTEIPKKVLKEANKCQHPKITSSQVRIRNMVRLD